MSRATRKKTYSVMSHQGFGEVTMVVNSTSFTIPQTKITKEGSISKVVLRLIKQCSCPKDLVRLNKLGVGTLSL